MQGFWNRLKADWYQKGLKHSTLPKVAVPFILNEARGARSFLDIGSGCGTMAIPLAKAGKKVTALDASGAMIEILTEEIKKRKLKGIKTVCSAWGEGGAGGAKKLKPHDAVLVSNVPALTKETEGFLRDFQNFSKRYVFIIEGADPEADKFYYKELYPLLFNKKFGPRADFLKTYTNLHAMGVFANVNVIEYDFDQPFADLEEAVMFWKEYMGIVTEEHDKKLEGFLRKKLVKTKDGLLAKFHKKSAIMWWKKGQ
jgi:SAM-dependent methyltransferase